MKDRIYQILLSPHISEKATIAGDKNNVHVFQVVTTATKPQVKDAVEQLFSTKVKTVRIVNVRSKTKTFKGAMGTRSGWKKAYVTLEAGQKIDLIGAQ